MNVLLIAKVVIAYIAMFGAAVFFSMLVLGGMCDRRPESAPDCPYKIEPKQ